MKLSALSQKLCPKPLPELSGNIYCIGRNYADHAKELQNEIPSEPVVFLKAASALRTLDAKDLAFPDESYHHEVEILLLVGRDVALGSKARLEDIAALSLGLDLTRREVQNELKKKGLPWTTAKSFAGSGIVHPFAPCSDIPKDIGFSLDINGERKQSGQSRDMIFDFLSILNFLTRYQDLLPGDIVFTGTPAGVGPFRKGDRFRLQSRELGVDAQAVL